MSLKSKLLSVSFLFLGGGRGGGDFFGESSRFFSRWWKTDRNVDIMRQSEGPKTWVTFGISTVGYRHWEGAWTLSQADWMQQWICASVLGKTCTHLHDEGKTAFVWENCSGVTEYKLPDVAKFLFFFFFSPDLKCWLKYVTDKYMHWCMVSAAVWLPPLKYKKNKAPSTQPQTGHIRHRAAVHARIICTCIASQTTAGVPSLGSAGQVGNHRSNDHAWQR